MLYSLGLFMGKSAGVCEREYVYVWIVFSVECYMCKKTKNITYPRRSLHCHHKEHATLSTCH